MWFASRRRPRARTSSGRHPGSGCHPPSPALRDPRQAGETALTTLMTRRAASRSHPSLPPPLTLQEETSSFPPSPGPCRRPLKAWPGGPVGPGGGQGRPLLYQEPPPGAGGREEETPPGLPVACSRGSPADQGLQVLSGGPDLRCFPTPSAPPPAPGGHCWGPPCCPSTPASSLAGRAGTQGDWLCSLGPTESLGVWFQVHCPTAYTLHSG